MAWYRKPFESSLFYKFCYRLTVISKGWHTYICKKAKISFIKGRDYSFICFVILVFPLSFARNSLTQETESTSFIFGLLFLYLCSKSSPRRNVCRGSGIIMWEYLILLNNVFCDLYIFLILLYSWTCVCLTALCYNMIQLISAVCVLSVLAAIVSG